MSFNIFLCGVGGQGLVLLTSVIGNACVKAGVNAITGEMYGLSQRNGTVFVHMRIGGDAYSPLIDYGDADVLMSLEAIETLRYIEYLRRGGVVIMNSRIMHPPIETSKLIADKSARYISLDAILAKISVWTSNIATVDALKLAKETGNLSAENIVLLGCLSALKAFPIEAKLLKESIAELVPPKTVEQNLNAFELGRMAAYDSLCSRVSCWER